MKEYRVQVAQLLLPAGGVAPDPGEAAVLTVREEPKPFVEVSDISGDIWGILPPRGELAKRIIARDEIFEAEFSGTTHDEFGDIIKLRLRVVVGELSERASPSPAPKEPERYKIGLRGESNYQPAIRQLSVGDPIRLQHEPHNPHDRDAIAALDGKGQHIGYVPRDSWVTRAMLDEHKSVTASVATVDASGIGILGVVLDVVLGPPTWQKADFEPVDTATVALAPSVQSDDLPPPATVRTSDADKRHSLRKGVIPAWSIALVIGVLATCMAIILMGHS